MVHHTAPHIPFKSSDEWNAAQAQLNGTIHYDPVGNMSSLPWLFLFLFVSCS
jgi:fatty acid desaturase